MIFWSLLLSMSNWFPTQYPSIWIIVVISFSNNVIFSSFFFILFFFYLKDWFSNQYLSISIITMSPFSNNVIFLSSFLLFFFFSFTFSHFLLLFLLKPSLCITDWFPLIRIIVVDPFLQQCHFLSFFFWYDSTLLFSL